MIKKVKKTKRQLKAERIKAEEQRLSQLYKNLENEKKSIADSLIKRAAFMRVELEDLEEYLNIHHWTEKFQQGENQKPYMRARPEGQIYNSLNKNYQSLIKQLNDLLPEESDEKEATALLDFVAGKKIK